jgi:hypothetical protein
VIKYNKMKVSRKVGRRSHSSVSRRRLRNKKTKSGYRKKHTQQGGRRGRGHKRARTHKRGKRFHRGGENGFDNCNNIRLVPLYRNRDGSPIPQSDDGRVHRKYFSRNTPKIYYTKIGSRIQNGENSEFTSSKVRWESHEVFTIFVDFITSGDNVDLVIVFIRDTSDDKSPTFVFQKQGSKGEIRQFLENMPSLITDNDQTESDEKLKLTTDNNIFEPKIYPGSPRREYSFKSSKNLATFKKIADCIKSKIPGVADAAIPSHLVHADTAPLSLHFPEAGAPVPGGDDDEYDTKGPENVIPATISRTETDEDEDEDERKQNERYSLNPTMAPLVRQAQKITA